MSLSLQNKKRVRVIALLVVIGAALYGGYVYKQNKGTEGSGQQNNQSRMYRMPLAPVQAALVKTDTVARSLSALGTVQAANSVTITSRVEGQLMKVHFVEGQHVNAGDLLFEIDPRPFNVQLAQAQGQLGKNQAILTNAKRDLARFNQLSKTHLISAQELDNQRALVSQSEASIKIDQAAIDSAQLQLTYSRITAPISGKVGLKLVDVGNFISSGTSMPLVVINQTTPVDVVFSVPENDINAVQMALKKSPELPVIAWDRNQQYILGQGQLITMNNQIDQATGTIKMKARFANSDDKLFPNQFVNIQLQVATLENALVIPNAALQMGSEGHFIWLLNKDETVSKQLVTVEYQDADTVVLSGGVNAGDLVITDGIDRLSQGIKVEVVTPDSPSKNTDENAAKPNSGSTKGAE